MRHWRGTMRSSEGNATTINITVSSAPITVAANVRAKLILRDRVETHIQQFLGTQSGEPASVRAAKFTTIAVVSLRNRCLRMIDTVAFRAREASLGRISGGRVG